MINFTDLIISCFNFPQVDQCQLAKTWVSSSFKPKRFRDEKAMAPDWYSMQWFLGCCVSNIIPSYSVNKYRPPHFICFEWEHFVKNDLIAIYFSVMDIAMSYTLIWAAPQQIFDYYSVWLKIQYASNSY